MAYRRTPFVPNEWFHCYTRGVEGRSTFETPRDYERFMESLYLCNSSNPVRRDDLDRASDSNIFLYPRGENLVDIGAYCLMPNHFHLLLRSKIDGGITRFMQKIGTAYTMYFNIKNKRVGGLFITPFRSKHVSEDYYFKRVAQYIHLNPIDLFEPGWKSGTATTTAATTARRRLAVVEKKLAEYQYGSMSDYYGDARPEGAIIDPAAFKLIQEDMLPLNSLLEERALYYQELNL